MCIRNDTLGCNGQCCQNIGGGPVPGRPPFPPSSGSTCTYGTTRRVRRSTWGGQVRWNVSNHPAGPRSFATWREAMDYATAQMFLINGAA